MGGLTSLREDSFQVRKVFGLGGLSRGVGIGNFAMPIVFWMRWSLSRLTCRPHFAVSRVFHFLVNLKDCARDRPVTAFIGALGLTVFGLIAGKKIFWTR